jgi:hypothetical protein
MMLKSLMVCERSQVRYTKRDGLIGAGVMVGASLILTVASVAAKRAGWSVAGEVVLALAFPGSLTLSMPFWLMKGQPRRAQVVIVGGTLLFLAGIGYLSTLI